MEQENHHRLKRIFNKGYVSFQEGTPPKFNSSPLKNDWQKFQGRAVKLPGVQFKNCLGLSHQFLRYFPPDLPKKKGLGCCRDPGISAHQGWSLKTLQNGINGHRVKFATYHITYYTPPQTNMDTIPKIYRHASKKGDTSSTTNHFWSFPKDQPVGPTVGSPSSTPAIKGDGKGGFLRIDLGDCLVVSWLFQGFNPCSKNVRKSNWVDLPQIDTTT